MSVALEVFTVVVITVSLALIALLLLGGICAMLGIGRLPPGQVTVSPPPPPPLAPPRL